MGLFRFENLAHSSLADSVLLSDLYFEAKTIDSPVDYFAKLPPAEQEEILSFYRCGKFLKVFRDDELVGFVGHGTKPESDTILIFYILLPSFRGHGLFRPLIDAFGLWCLEHYPDKKFFRANTEKSNLASIRSLQKAGFQFLEETTEGPDQERRALFHCYGRRISVSGKER